MAEQGCGQPGGSYPTDCELTEALRERARQRNRPVVR
ncbi:MAG: 3-deoxy-D-manno-octulosonate 8-phosphate phosphatase, partial [Desulfobulbaceae bacterium]|nr:3-deoxy-D-manno-octulosonate 8-phosphate phosphatase [Desulfobulbaceae bacterium]